MVCRSGVFSINADRQKIPRQFIFPCEEVGEQMLLAYLLLLIVKERDDLRKELGLGEWESCRDKRESRPFRNSETFRIERCNYFSYAMGKK